MSGGGGAEAAGPTLSVEGMNGVIEFVGAVFRVGCFIATALVLGGGTAEIVGAGSAMVGGCSVVGAGGELVRGAVAG